MTILTIFLHPVDQFALPSKIGKSLGQRYLYGDTKYLREKNITQDNYGKG